MEHPRDPLKRRPGGQPRSAFDLGHEDMTQSSPLSQGRLREAPAESPCPDLRAEGVAGHILNV